MDRIADGPHGRQRPYLAALLPCTVGTDGPEVAPTNRGTRFPDAQLS
jgi:hypothetical protein